MNRRSNAWLEHPATDGAPPQVRALETIARPPHAVNLQSIGGIRDGGIDSPR